MTGVQTCALPISGDAPPPEPVKNQLQELVLGQGTGLPQYVVVSNTGPSHAPLFVVRVTAQGRHAEGQGPNRLAADNAAAQAWLAGHV